MTFEGSIDQWEVLAAHLHTRDLVVAFVALSVVRSFPSYCDSPFHRWPARPLPKLPCTPRVLPLF